MTIGHLIHKSADYSERLYLTVTDTISYIKWFLMCNKVNVFIKQNVITHDDWSNGKGPHITLYGQGSETHWQRYMDMTQQTLGMKLNNNLWILNIGYLQTLAAIQIQNQKCDEAQSMSYSSWLSFSHHITYSHFCCCIISEMHILISMQIHRIKWNIRIMNSTQTCDVCLNCVKYRKVA